MRRPRGWLPVLLAAGLGVAPAWSQDEGEVDPDELYAWGAVSSVVEVDEDGDSRLVGFFFHTDEGETFEVIMDDTGRALAKEASDRLDVIVELEGTLSVDQEMVTVREFRIVYVSPGDDEAGDGEPEE